MRIVSISRPQYSKRDCYEENRCRKEFWLPFFGLAILIVLPAARADQSNEAIKVTFRQPVQIPGRVLQAGTFWFELPEDINQHYLVRIYNADRTRLYAFRD